ncbi:MAG TPA: glutathione S-transferase [bacterium]|nr:glutathione S-transferase [bacterium]
MPDLYGIAYSPWTMKARWALDHHKIPYRYREHLILFGMPELRWRLKKPFGDITVPLLVNGGGNAVMDSFEIARHVDVTGSGTTLFPEGRLEEIREINRLSETALDSVRALTIFRILEDKDAQLELLPAFIPRRLRRCSRWMVPVGINYLIREFAVRKKTKTGFEEDYRLVLEDFRKRLAASATGRLLGDFTFADIAAAAALQGVEPVDHPSLPMSPTIRRLWRHPELAKDYEDLLKWRDSLFLEYR